MKEMMRQKVRDIRLNSQMRKRADEVNDKVKGGRSASQTKSYVSLIEKAKSYKGCRRPTET